MVNWVLVTGIAIFAVGLYVRFSARDPSLQGDFKAITYNENIEKLLKKYKDVIGSDLPGYKNHCYRVLSYTHHFLHGKVTPAQNEVITTALVYHDIGLWTDKTLAYLEPSSERALEVYRGKYSPEDQQLLHDIIYWHHKITPFVGPNADIVNAVRKADWIDATQSTVHQGMPRQHIAHAYATIPVAGFYDTLQQFGPRLYGNDVMRIVKEMVSILKW